MKFHHIVQINDPLHPLLDPLTRTELWNGLVMRAENPVSFVLDLDLCELTARTEHSLQRRLHFGPLIIEDEVFFETGTRVRYVTRAQPGLPSATLTMTIQEPAPELLALRFDYDTGESPSVPGQVDAFYDSFRQSAYKHADIDTVGRIRELAREGRLATLQH